jgi:hypothetical protein
MKRTSVIAAFLVISLPSVVTAQELTFNIHGSAKSCYDIWQLDRAIAGQYQSLFDGWTVADYDAAIAWASQCSQYGWQNAASSRIPTLQSLSAPLRPVIHAPPPVEEPKGIVFHGDIASWSGIPPLPPDSGKKQTPHRSIQCTVGDATDHMVSIWTTEKGCKEWLDAAKRLATNGPTHRQVEDFRARQIASEPADPNNIYAMFLCFKSIGSCRAIPEIFPTLNACHFRAGQMTLYKNPTPEGHFLVPPDMWYECRSKHMDRWQPAR